MSNENEKDLKNIAFDAIGEGDSDEDWKIVPTEHAAMFAEQAPSLAENLRGSRPQQLAETYEEQNNRAIKARNDFRSTVGRANTAVFYAASFGALLLIAAGLQASLGEVGRWGVAAIGLVGFASSGLASMWLNQVKGADLGKRWADTRAKAEAKRLAYFKALMEGALAEPLDQLLAFEYTRRFLLDNQIDYFHDRGDQHERAADLAVKNSTRAAFCASALTAAAGFLAVWQPQLAVIAGLGAIVSAYATWVTSRSAVDLDRKNADRYRAAEDALLNRKMDLDIYRAEIASGKQGAVQEFFEPIFVALEADHRAFLNDAEQREAAIGAMQRRLDEAKKSLKDRPQEPDGAKPDNKPGP